MEAELSDRKKTDQSFVEDTAGPLREAWYYAASSRKLRRGGLLGRVMPQMNVMAASMSIRAAVGILVVWLGLQLTGEVIGNAIEDSMVRVQSGWTMAAHTR